MTVTTLYQEQKRFKNLQQNTTPHTHLKKTFYPDREVTKADLETKYNSWINNDKIIAAFNLNLNLYCSVCGYESYKYFSNKCWGI